MTAISRTDHRVVTADGIGLRVRLVQPANVPAAALRDRVLVLLHGMETPLEPTFDLDVPGYSFMEQMAARGHAAIAFDHRNFGRSDRDPAMGAEPVPDGAGPALFSLDAAAEDTAAVVEDTCARFGVSRVTLLGSSQGTLHALAYAARRPERVRLVIMNNPLAFCFSMGATEGPRVEETRRMLARYNARFPHSYRVISEPEFRASLRHRYDLDPAVEEGYIASCVQSDPDSGRSTPPGFRVPKERFPDRVPVIDCARIRTPILMVTAEDVTDDDVAALAAQLPHPRLRLLRIRDSDHSTLRNPRRFELYNIVDAALSAWAWAEGAP
ncbi:MAG TPA: alpha/beta fold hydrolase [Kofleriaceae bacterium]|nr:alpha/beta fold hydrolase [Kofleriaceae bacterium]